MIYYVGKWDMVYVAYDPDKRYVPFWKYTTPFVKDKYKPIPASILLKAIPSVKEEELRSYLIKRLKELL